MERDGWHEEPPPLSAEEMAREEERIRRKREARWQAEDEAWDEAMAARAKEEMIYTRGAVGCLRYRL